MSGNQPYNERETLLRVAGGDEQAFRIIFYHYYPLLRHATAGYALTEADREDMLHETFIRIWLSRDKLPEINDPAAWFCRIASRECLRTINRNGRRQLLLAADTDHNETPTPEDLSNVAQLKRNIADALDLMPDQRRRIFLLSRNEGLKPAEIAERLQLSVSTVKNTLVSALKDIRAHLASSGMDIPLSLLLAILQNFF